MGGGSPAWSPDGRTIAFDSLKSGSYDVWIIDAEGGVPRQLTFEPSDDGTPSWSRDGRWIYFHSDRSGSSQVWRMPAQGGEASQVTRNRGFYGRESWDGKTLYYTKSQSGTSLWRVPVEGGEETEFVKGPIPSFPDWDLSRTGIYFLTTTTRDSLRDTWVVGAPKDFTLSFAAFQGGSTAELYTWQSTFLVFSVLVSPDDEWVLYAESLPGTDELVLIENFR